MASIPTAAKAPAKSGTGANFVKCQNGTTVSPAKSRGETRAIPQTHCSSKRAASNVKATY